MAQWIKSATYGMVRNRMAASGLRDWEGQQPALGDNIVITS